MSSGQDPSEEEMDVLREMEESCANAVVSHPCILPETQPQTNLLAPPRPFTPLNVDPLEPMHMSPLTPLTQLPQDPGQTTLASRVPLRTGLSVKRRIRGKQPDPWMVIVLTKALEAEGAEDEAALAATARRRHVHFTHVRTFDPEHIQPSQFTRKELWLHLEKCYGEVYPCGSSRTGSILQFGKVSKERIDEEDEHHHVATFSLQQHYLFYSF